MSHSLLFITLKAGGHGEEKKQTPEAAVVTAKPLFVELPTSAHHHVTESEDGTRRKRKAEDTDLTPTIKASRSEGAGMIQVYDNPSCASYDLTICRNGAL